MPQIGEGKKFPFMGFGQSYNRAVIADATIEFVGSGLVGTAYGFPGFSATLVGTGLYDCRFPSTAALGARIFPHAMGPEAKGPTGARLGPQGSGAQIGAAPGFAAHMSHVGGQSGFAFLNVVSPFVSPSGAVGPTGARYMFPPTGSSVNLQFLASPITRY
jgi:hypothetical protein